MNRTANRIVTLGLAVSLGLLASPAWARDLKLTGPDGQTATLAPADVAALPHMTLTVQIEGKTNVYDGVPLLRLLERVGAPTGKSLGGPAMRDIVIVTAGDGYAAALALAEADPGFRKDQILLADRADGHALGETIGPYRLVVQGDLRGARDVRMVTSIEVRSVR
jgi:hypothetical protein